MKVRSTHEIRVDERRNESSTRTIDVNVDVESLLFVVLDEEVVDSLDVLVLSRVRRSEDCDDVRAQAMPSWREGCSLAQTKMVFSSTRATHSAGSITYWFSLTNQYLSSQSRYLAAFSQQTKRVE